MERIMYKNIAKTVALTCSLVFSPIVLAQSCNCPEGLKHMVESLKLDDSQKTKIAPILAQLASTVKNDTSQMNDLAQQQKQQFESENMEQATVDGLIDKRTKLIGDIIKAKVAAKKQILALLTPQQKTDFQNKMNSDEEKMTEQFKNCPDY